MTIRSTVFWLSLSRLSPRSRQVLPSVRGAEEGEVPHVLGDDRGPHTLSLSGEDDVRIQRVC